MKVRWYSILWILIVPISLFSCKKTETPPIGISKMWKCHHETEWDSLKTRDALIGNWKWEFISCYWTPEDANNDDFRGLEIEFKSDSTLVVKENGQITGISQWKVIDGDADLFAVDVTPRITQLYGRILFCGNRVQFNHSYIDGCDNYFIRK